MKTTLHKNQKGFSHHFILPVIAIMLVAGIGSYVMLRSSSAAAGDNCYKKKITSSWVTCKDTGYLSSKWKGKYYQYKLRIAKTTSSSKYIQVVPLSKTYTFDSGHTKVHVTPGKWSISCGGNQRGATVDDLKGSKTVKFNKDFTNCSVSIHYDVVQNGPKDGYTHRSTALKGDSFKI